MAFCYGLTSAVLHTVVQGFGVLACPLDAGASDPVFYLVR